MQIYHIHLIGWTCSEGGIFLRYYIVGSRIFFIAYSLSQSGKHVRNKNVAPYLGRDKLSYLPSSLVM